MRIIGKITFFTGIGTLVILLSMFIYLAYKGISAESRSDRIEELLYRENMIGEDMQAAIDVFGMPDRIVLSGIALYLKQDSRIGYGLPAGITFEYRSKLPLIRIMIPPIKVFINERDEIAGMKHLREW